MAAVDIHGAAVAALIDLQLLIRRVAAADAGGAPAALGRNRAAVDGDIAAVSADFVIGQAIGNVVGVVAAAADARAAVSASIVFAIAAGGVNIAAEDGDVAAVHKGRVIAAFHIRAADARAAVGALGLDVAAVDGDARHTPADAGVDQAGVRRVGFQPPGVEFLAVDGKGVAQVSNIPAGDAPDAEKGAVLQDNLDVAVDVKLKTYVFVIVDIVVIVVALYDVPARLQGCFCTPVMDGKIDTIIRAYQRVIGYLFPCLDHLALFLVPSALYVCHGFRR